MRRIVFQLTLLFATVAALPARPQAQHTPDRFPDPRFGIVEAYQAPDISRRLGAAWQRVRFHWGEIQPDGPDEWIEEEVTLAHVQAEVAAGREVAGMLIGLPGWAADDQRLPRGLYRPPDDPDNEWANFVRRAVRRYRHLIDHWIIWNEPDVWDAGHPGFTWPGDERDFAQLLRVAYLVAKEENPAAIIHLPGLSHYWDTNFGRTPYLLRLVEAIEAIDSDAGRNNDYFDAVTLHLYFNPEANYELLTRYIAWLRDNGLEQPVWLVETNAAPSLDPEVPVQNPLFRVSLAEQAAYVPQMMALGLAAGVDRIAIYTLLDPREGADPEPFGLIRPDGTARPAAQAFAVAARYLSGATSAEVRARDAVWWVQLDHPDRVTHVLWARGGESLPVDIPALTDYAQRVTLYGETGWLAAQDGRYTLELPGAECNNDPCFIGGAPVYLVEFK